MHESNNLKIVSKTEDVLLVENYLVLFGGRDLQGETFSNKMTLEDFESAYTKTGQVMVDWDHGFDWNDGAPGRDDVLGVVDWKTAKVDDRGLWARQALDRRSEYMAYLETLIEEGLIGSSTEATNKAQVHAGTITKWPIKRNALTVTPAEPRMLSENAILAVKALSGKIPSLKALLPKAGEIGADGAADEMDPDFANLNIQTKKVKTMAEHIEPTVDLAAIKAQALVDAKAELEAEAAKEAAFDAKVADAVKAQIDEFSKSLPAVNAAGFPALQLHKSDLGDTEEAAYIAYLKTGDIGALRAFAGANAVDPGPEGVAKALGQMKASNATDMNITTAGDGGNLVPTGHYQGIVAKRDESDLATKLGCMEIPGVGTTVNVPYDDEDDGEFVETSESGTYDVDSPAVGQATSTLVAYTKNIPLTRQLLRDEDSKLLAFLTNWIGRAVAKTRNSLLVAEAANGTSLVTFASATAIAFGEPEAILYNDNLSDYLDDTESVAWIMMASVLGEIRQLKGDQRQYAYGMSEAGARDLLGYPVHFSQKVGATAAGVKSVLFGNWFYMGHRDGGGMGFLRDPYSNAAKGWVNLWYYIDEDFVTLQSEAFGYGIQATA